MIPMIVSRVIALFLIWVPASVLFYLLLLHDLHEKTAMTGDELVEHYKRIGPMLASPIMAAIVMLINLVLVLFFYEIIAGGLYLVLRRFLPKT
jgi:hypothetical protein